MAIEEKKVRPSVKRTQVGTSLDKDLYATLKQFSHDSRIPQSKLFDEALELLFNKYNIRIINHTES
nr:ribbon-helix-helix domain-containing protein [uncultured Cellulosilyticum sp.]